MTRSIANLAGLVLAFFLVGVAWGVGTTANVSWTVPTTYIDGSAMPASDIASYTINWTGGVPGTLTVNAPATTANVPVPCGSATFTVSVTTTAAAKYPNATSAPSNAVPYASGVTCVPAAPVLTVK